MNDTGILHVDTGRGIDTFTENLYSITLPLHEPNRTTNTANDGCTALQADNARPWGLVYEDKHLCSLAHVAQNEFNYGVKSSPFIIQSTQLIIPMFCISLVRSHVRFSVSCPMFAFHCCNWMEYVPRNVSRKWSSHRMAFHFLERLHLDWA